MIGDEIRAHVVCPDAGDDGVKAAEVPAGQQSLPGLLAQSLLVTSEAVRAGIPLIGGCGVYSSADAQAMLQKIIDGRWLTAQAVVGLYPANAQGEDIVFYADEGHVEPRKVLPELHARIGAAGGTKPLPVSEREVQNIIGQVEEGVERPKPTIRFDIGEKYVFLAEKFQAKDLRMSRRFHPWCDEFHRWEIAILECISQHDVPGEWDDEIKYDGFIFKDAEGHTWNNQYPRASYGQLSTDNDQRLWPADTFVDFDHSLNTAIKKLRQALVDDAETPKYIETLPRRGYRFIEHWQWPYTNYRSAILSKTLRA